MDELFVSTSNSVDKDNGKSTDIICTKLYHRQNTICPRCQLSIKNSEKLSRHLANLKDRIQFIGKNKIDL